MRIVLVEDSQDDAELMMRSLKKSNVVNDVVWLKDGEEALNYFFQKGEYAGEGELPKPSLILLDLKLPKLSGIEVLRELKANQRLKSVPVVVLTSSHEHRDLEFCYELGANSYAVKPIDFNTFMEVTKEISVYWLMINKAPE